MVYKYLRTANVCLLVTETREITRTKTEFLRRKNIQVAAWLIAHVLYLQFLLVLSKYSIMCFYEYTH